MNAAKGTVPIQLDRPRTLKYTFAAMEAVETLCGLNLLIPDKKTLARLKAPNMTLIRAMFYGCLKDEDPDITPEQAGDMILEYGAEHIMGPVMEAYRLGMPDSKGNGKKAKDAEATPDPRHGSMSGPSLSAVSNSPKRRSGT